MKFTDELFQEIELRKWDVENFFLQLRKERVVIWGTGLAGLVIYEALERLQIPVFLFADNNKEKQGTSVCGKKVVAIDGIPENAFVIIAADVKYGIHEQLQKVSLKYKYMDPHWLYTYGTNDVFSVLRENTDSINRVYGLLTDGLSKKVFKNVLLHRGVHDLSLIWEVYDENQYFGNRIIKKAGQNCVDCGAFQGDTLLRFLNQMEDGKKCSYYAFEADRDNCQVIKRICGEKHLDWVRPINLGVWDKSGKLHFSQEGCRAVGESSGKIIEGSVEDGATINVDSLDAVLGNTEIDFITMDIEGAEIKALHGAENCIQRNRPVLAISAYHKLEHLWEVPLLIKEIDAGYDIRFGHHRWNMADTVCYGLPVK